LRTARVDKHALDRTETTVVVGGHPIRVKIAVHDGSVVNANAEYDDVVATADALRRPVKAVLAEAAAAALSAAEAQTARKKASAPE
jgi:uncharacterized protein (DUF111 family)